MAELCEPVRDLLVFGAGRVDFAHFDSKRFEFPLHLLQRFEDAEAFGKNRSPTDVEAVLRKVADFEALHRGD